MRKSMPSVSIIFDYWKDKAITKDGNIIFEEEADYATDIEAIIDWGEKRCMACGKYLGDGGYTNNKHIERCHIVPKALNGTFEPSNMVLLCKECHKNSPDCSYPKYMLKWIYLKRTREYSGTIPFFIRKKVMDICKTYPYAHLVEKKKIKEIEKNMSCHGPFISSGIIDVWFEKVIEKR